MNIKVKQLNFERTDSFYSGQYLLAQSPVGDYGVFKQLDKGRWDYGKYFLVKFGGMGIDDVEFSEFDIDSEEEAIEHANYWFRQEVMKCIDFE